MRIWSIHPKYLDSQGLVALWRETLLAQHVLANKTKGYKNHPQLLRFKDQKDPMRFIGTYLFYIYIEAEKRGYSFNKRKIIKQLMLKKQIPVTTGQTQYEFLHLKKKLKTRSPDIYHKIKNTGRIQLHPLFRSKRGEIESWEKL